jgi:Ran GTPase-activating protein (RanGAP) involved in mRNA processing and transport
MEYVLLPVPSKTTPTLRYLMCKDCGSALILNLFHKVIDLNDNTFTEVGSKAMAGVLPDLQKLKVINFGDCLVRPEGAHAIADAIKEGHQQLEVRAFSHKT